MSVRFTMLFLFGFTDFIFRASTSGNNTANVLQEIGVLDTLLVKAKVPPQARHTTLKFYAGEGDHEAIHDVCPFLICKFEHVYSLSLQQPTGPAEGSFGVTR